MREAFLTQHEERFIQDLGPTVTLQPAPIAGHLQHRILESAQRANMVPKLGYHGTAVRNHASIFAHGLRIPGQGGVQVVHGSAHGIGIYTATEGCSNLSWGFVPHCDPQKLLVVGVVDQKFGKRMARGSGHERGVKFHRQTKKARSAQSHINGRKVHSDKNFVRHVGNARVIFDEQRVMPLFVANADQRTRPEPVSVSVSASRYPYRCDYQSIASGPLQGAASEMFTQDPVQRAGKRQARVCDTGETVWVAPEAMTWDKQAIRLKRDMVSKQRSERRAKQRDQKATMMAHTQ